MPNPYYGGGRPEGGRGHERDRDRWGDWRERERLGGRDEGRGYRDDWRAGDRPRGGEWRDRDEVMEGGDRGWPGGVRGAEGGGGYGRGWFAEAYSLYAGRPEREEHGRWARMGHPAGGRIGRGPKGYRRSDERVHDDVCERIARSGVNADEVEVRVESGEVTLTGTVERREEKRFLEDLAEDVFGVSDVHNQIRVVPGERSPTARGETH
jgi:hypothetical protein